MRCMILLNHNSPQAVRVKNVTTLGRHCSELLNWSKFQDYNFYENTFVSDKIDQWPEDLKDKLKNPDKSLFINDPVSGKKIFGRLVEGIKTPHDPSQNLRYVKVKRHPNEKPTTYFLTQKRQNLYRNTYSSNNILTKAVRSERFQQLKKNLKIDEFDEVNIDKPAFITSPDNQSYNKKQ